MLIQESNTVTATNGASHRDRCCCCGKAIHAEHDPTCVYRRRTIVVDLKLRTVIEVPQSWTDGQIADWVDAREDLPAFEEVLASGRVVRHEVWGDEELGDEKDERWRFLFGSRYWRDALAKDHDWYGYRRSFVQELSSPGDFRCKDPAVELHQVNDTAAHRIATDRSLDLTEVNMILNRSVGIVSLLRTHDVSVLQQRLKNAAYFYQHGELPAATRAAAGS